MSTPLATHSSFIHHNLLVSGSALDNALAVKRAQAENTTVQILSFDNRNGRQIDFDLRGSDEDIARRLEPSHDDPAQDNSAGKRGRGRPKLGVVSREITLLPRHWEWLAEQPGSASVTLRKLVDEARRKNAGADEKRRRRDRVYHFISAIAGDLTNFEDASRALYQDDQARFEMLIAAWPSDVRDHALRLWEADL